MHNFALKFIMVGDSRVGKSQLTRCFTKKPFNYDSQTTVGMEFCNRTIEFEKCVIKAQLWDTAGQERFESMTKAYYRDAVGAALVYDVCNLQSFHSLRNTWLRQLKDYGHERMRMILVGNKLDLVDRGLAQRQVPVSLAIDFARELNIDFIETSALTGFAVENMFRRMVLSVAKLLPEVRVHLELTALPDGWMIEFNPANQQQQQQKQISDDSQSTTTAAIMESLDGSLATTRCSAFSAGPGITPAPTAESHETVAMCADSSPRSAGVVDPPVGDSPQRQSVVQGPLSIRPVSVRGSVGSAGSMATPTSPTIQRFVYINYWTAESQLELPSKPAATGLLYATLPLTTLYTDTPAGVPSTTAAQKDDPDGGDANFVRKSLDDRALTERSSSARTLDLRKSDVAQQRRVRTCPTPCVIS